MRIVDTVREPLVVLDAKLRIESASKAFFDKVAVSAEETLSKSLSDLGDRQWDIPVLRKLLAEVLPKSKKIEGYEVEPELPKLARRCYSMADASSGETAKNRCSFFRSNVTERKRAEESESAVQGVPETLAERRIVPRLEHGRYRRPLPPPEAPRHVQSEADPAGPCAVRSHRERASVQPFRLRRILGSRDLP